MDKSHHNVQEAERLFLALKASNEGIWDWNVGERKIYYSRRVLEFFECSSASAPNPFLPPHDHVHPEEREAFVRALHLALEHQGPEIFATDCRIRTGSDGWRWLRIRGTVVRNRTGECTRIVGSMIDISRRKAAEAQIEEERHLLRMLIDHVPLQVYFKDRESRLVLANRKMAEWMGLDSPQQLLGKHDRDFFENDHSEQAHFDEQQIMETCTPVTEKLEHETWHDGEDSWVLSSKFPWVDRMGEVRGTFGVSSDVTALVKAQREATELAGELQLRNKVYEEELQLAREIQQSLAGANFPEIGKNRPLSFAARYIPTSGLAGDFFETVRISDSSAGMLICDVMGHGVRSALIVAMLRGLLEKQRRSADEPATFLRGLNRGLAAILDRAGTTMFATAFYAVADLQAGTLRYACAGHPGAICVGKNGTRLLAGTRKEKGPGLGLMLKADYPAGEIPLEEVDRLLLFTDGILEAENESGEAFMHQRLMQSAAELVHLPMDDMLDGLLDHVRKFSGNHQFEDDVCLLGLDVSHKQAAVTS
jgi:phosphoserine phosphatase RsbU/P